MKSHVQYFWIGCFFSIVSGDAKTITTSSLPKEHSASISQLRGPGGLKGSADVLSSFRDHQWHGRYGKMMAISWKISMQTRDKIVDTATFLALFQVIKMIKHWI